MLMKILLLKLKDGKCFFWSSYIEHIPGKTNIIADGFSRFVHFPEKDVENYIEREDIDLLETFLAGLIDPLESPQKYYNVIA